MTVADTIYERVKDLPDPLAHEVLHFIDGLRHRQVRAESGDLIKAQATSLAPVWDNPDDQVWDDA